MRIGSLLQPPHIKMAHNRLTALHTIQLQHQIHGMSALHLVMTVLHLDMTVHHLVTIALHLDMTVHHLVTTALHLDMTVHHLAMTVHHPVTTVLHLDMTVLHLDTIVHHLDMIDLHLDMTSLHLGTTGLHMDMIVHHLAMIRLHLGTTVLHPQIMITTEALKYHHTRNLAQVLDHKCTHLTAVPKDQIQHFNLVRHSRVIPQDHHKILIPFLHIHTNSHLVHL